MLALGSYVKRLFGNSVHIDVLDLNVELILKKPIEYKKLLNQCFKLIEDRIKHGGHLIGFSTKVNVYPLILDLSVLIKKWYPKSVIVFGGAQATLTSTQTVDLYHDLVDYIVCGEGEIAFCKLLSAILSDRKMDKLICCEMVDDVDLLPYQDISMLSLANYSGVSNHKHMFPIELGRGCNYNCSYCSASLMWGRKCRFKSVKRYVEELKFYTHEYNIHYYDFVSDNIAQNRNYVLEICTEIRARKLDVNWECHARMDQLDKDLIKKMSLAGCNSIFIGMESFSEKVLKKINKGYHVNCKEIMEIMDALVENNIRTTVSLMYGFPFEKVDDVAENIFRGLQLKMHGAENVVFSIVEPEPATRLLKENKDQMKFYIPPAIPVPFIMNDKISEVINKKPEIFSSFFSFSSSALAYNRLLKIKALFQLLSDKYPKTTSFLPALLNTRIDKVVDMFIDNPILWSEDNDEVSMEKFITLYVKDSEALLGLVKYEDLIWDSFNSMKNSANDENLVRHANGSKYILDKSVRVIDLFLDIEKLNEMIIRYYDCFANLYIPNSDKCNYYMMFTHGDSVKSYKVDKKLYDFCKSGTRLSVDEANNLIKYKIMSKYCVNRKEF